MLNHFRTQTTQCSTAQPKTTEPANATKMSAHLALVIEQRGILHQTLSWYTPKASPIQSKTHDRGTRLTSITTLRSQSDAEKEICNTLCSQTVNDLWRAYWRLYISSCIILPRHYSQPLMSRNYTSKTRGQSYVIHINYYHVNIKVHCFLLQNTIN